MQEFTRNVRREVARLKLLLQQYAIMSTQVCAAEAAAWGCSLCGCTALRVHALLLLLVLRPVAAFGVRVLWAGVGSGPAC